MKRACFSLCGLLLLCSLLLLSACKPDPIPSAAAPEATKSAASPTKYAIAPKPHIWQALPVLLEIFTSAGYTSPDYAWSKLPEMVLYADGRVIVTQFDRTSGRDERNVLESQLSQSDVCGILNQIEIDGFFDFDPREYQEPQVTDMGTTAIDVHAWANQSVSAYGLDFALYEPSVKSSVPAPLAATYQRLVNFIPPNAKPYQPDKIALLIQPLNEPDTAAPLWPLQDPTLNELSKRKDEEGVVLIEGQETTKIYELFDQGISQLYIENGATYHLTVRPLLPLEQYPLAKGWSPAPSFPATPTTEMTCEPGMSIVWPTVEVKPTQSLPSEPDHIPPTPTPNPVLQVEAPLKYVTSLGRHDDPGQLDGPAGLALGPNGEIIVGDLLNDRFEWYSPEGTLLQETVITATPISIWDFERMTDGRWYALGWNRVDVLSPDGQLLQTFEGWPEPKSDGGVSWSTHLAVAPDGTMYIAETRGARVVILNPDGSLKEIWTGPDNQPLDNIMSLDVDPQGNLYVASDNQNRIVKRTPDNQATEFPISAVIAIDAMPDGSFYVARRETNISHYSADGRLLQEWHDQRLHFVDDIVGAADGTVVVLSQPYPEIGPAVFRFSATGQPLTAFGDMTPQPGQFGGHYAFSASPAEDVWLVEKKNDPFSKEDPRIPTRLVHISSDDQHLGTFETVKDQPFTCDKYALAALSDQTVYLSDPCAGKIQHIDANGQVIQQWGQRGAGDNQFNLIRDLTLAPDEKSLYVVDEGNSRISRFSLTGELMQTWNTKDWDIGTPIGLAIDPAGTFYLLDSATNEIVVQPAQGNGQRWVLPNSEDAVNSIAVDVQRERIYVGGTGVYLYAFDLTGTYLGQDERDDSQSVMLETTTNGHLLASAGYEHIYVYEPK